MNLILKLEQGFKQRLFEMNHVFLCNIGVLPVMYHVIMLFEFAQLLFFVFYSVEITNEFESTSSSSSAQANSPSEATFRIDSYLTFTNF